jgi:heterokaryon incompatibility protein (HET)
MRLINVRTLDLRKFNQHPPRYAILSHRWIDEQEICLQDWEVYVANQDPLSSQIKCKSGFIKIQNACIQAQKRGFEWLWADTVCIDKRDNSEVTKSVNLMFSWYQSASVCFAYMHEVSNNNQRLKWTEDNAVVRKTPEWFTRGWTLQELLAPKKLLLSDQDWNCIGDRENCAQVITKFTGIPLSALCGKDIQSYSYADRLAWAKGRQTTEPEDRVYSLLGLLGVSLPAVGYGIGLKAALWQLESAIEKQRADGNLSLPDDDLFSRFIAVIDNNPVGMLVF